MRMRQFKPCPPIFDIRITPPIWKPDQEVSLKHDDLYARVWGCEYEQPIFDAAKANTTQPKSSENTVQSD